MVLRACNIIQASEYAKFVGGFMR